MSSTTTRRPRRHFGKIAKQRSGRYQASYIDPLGVRRYAERTFQSRGDASAWLSRRETESTDPNWSPPQPRRTLPLVGEYVAAWIAARPLKPRTRVLYEGLLRNHIEPSPIADVTLNALTPAMVREWHDNLETGATARANAYGVLRAALSQATDDELVDRNPVRVRGAGSKRRERVLRVIEPGALDRIVAEVAKSSPRYEALILLGGWCSLRFGELAALRRCDLDLKNGVVHVRQALTDIPGRAKFVDEPKSGSARDVAIPPHIVPVLRTHLLAYAAPGVDGLVFPPSSGEDGDYLALSTLHRVWDRAKVRAGCPDARVHDLRHFGAVQAARAGATLGELQTRLGHKTASAALVYQSAVSERDGLLAARMSAALDEAAPQR